MSINPLNTTLITNVSLLGEFPARRTIKNLINTTHRVIFMRFFYFKKYTFTMYFPTI